MNGWTDELTFGRSSGTLPRIRVQSPFFFLDDNELLFIDFVYLLLVGADARRDRGAEPAKWSDGKT